MKRRMLLSLAFLLVGICLAVVTVQAGGKATKTDVVGWIEPPIIWHQYGDVWTSGRIWGKMWIEQGGARVWEGSWNGEVLNSIQQGNAILHGAGINEGLKAKMSFVQRPGEYIIDFNAVILNPKGD